MEIQVKVSVRVIREVTGLGRMWLLMLSKGR
jgi:hypothetical protein